MTGRRHNAVDRRKHDAISRPDPVATALGGGMVLVGPIGVLRIAAALAASVEVTSRLDGIRPPAVVVGLRELFDAAAAEARRAAASGSAELPRSAAPSSSGASTAPVVVDPVGTAEAAELLGCTTRNVRDLCRRGVFETAAVLAGGWVVSRREVEARLLSRAS